MNPGRLLLPLCTLGLALGVSDRAAAECDVTGTVVDAEGQPVEGLDVELSQGAAPRHTTTDAQGRFHFGTVPGSAEVIARLADGGPQPRFVIMKGGEPVGLRASVDPAQRCDVTLGPDALPDAPDLLALVQGLRRGFALMERMGIHPTTTLRVEVDDPVASPDAVYWSGPSSFDPAAELPLRLVLGTEATRRHDPGAPDNREYHELGHHALATAFGALPHARDHVPGGGYHQNPTSTQAWTEGFAIFFAAMVAAEIEGRPDPSHYRVEGAWLDLELDYRPWDLRGTESVAVAGLLWDMVDGDREAQPVALELDEPRLHADTGVPRLLVGRVSNESDAPVTDARVRVRTPGWSGVAPIGPRLLPPDGEGWFVLPLPDAAGDDPLAELELTAGTRLATPDDDPVQVELPALWTAIAQLRSQHPQSNGRLYDVTDLYQALRGRFGGKDADGDGRDDIDQLFVAHGLFADTDGDRQHDPDEALGLTSHPGRTVQVEGTAVTWPDLIPRRRLSLPEPLRMRADLDPPDASVAVLVSGSAWGGYLAQPDPQGVLRVIPPPARQGQTVSVIAMAPGHQPTLLWHQDATALLAELETRRTPFLAVQATLPEAGPLGLGGGGASAWPRLAFGGGALAALVGLVLIAIGWPRFR